MVAQKILLIGGNSGLGLKIFEYLKPDFNIVTMPRDVLNISVDVSFENSLNYIRQINPTIIILNAFDRTNLDSQLKYLTFLWNELKYKSEIKIIVLSSASVWFNNWTDKTKVYADAKRKLSEFTINNGFVKYDDNPKASMILLEPATIETYNNLKEISIERQTLILSYNEFFEMLDFCIKTTLKFLRIGGEGSIKIT